MGAAEISVLAGAAGGAVSEQPTVKARRAKGRREAEVFIGKKVRKGQKKGAPQGSAFENLSKSLFAAAGHETNHHETKTHEGVGGGLRNRGKLTSGNRVARDVGIDDGRTNSGYQSAT